MGKNQILVILFNVVAIVIAIEVHQLFYALTSVLLGDNLPKKERRITLNPIKHIEPVGFILMLMSMFGLGSLGWGKPVNINPAYYKDKKFGTIIVSFSGITANLCLAATISLLLNFIYFPGLSTQFLASIVYYNIFLAVINLIPIYPLDGYRLLLISVKPNMYYKLIQNEKIIQMVLVFLSFANILQIVVVPIINLIYNLLIG